MTVFGPLTATSEEMKAGSLARPYLVTAAISLVGLAAALLSIFVLVPALQPDIGAAVQHFTVLSPSNEPGTWSGFLDTRDPWALQTIVRMKLFNLTNSECVLNNGTAVNLQVVGDMQAFRHRLVAPRSMWNRTLVFTPSFWWELVSQEDQQKMEIFITSIYMPMITLFAHGFAPDAVDGPSHTNDAIATGSRAGRHLSGMCDDASAQEGDAGCALSAREASAVSRLRGTLARVRWLLAHTMDLLHASEWEQGTRGGVHPASEWEQGTRGGVHPASEWEQGTRRGAHPATTQVHGHDLAAGTAEADVALLRAFPLLRTTHPMRVILTAFARASYASRPGLGKAWADLLFGSRTAGEVLFGYNDPLYEALNDLNTAFPDRYPGLLGNATDGDWPETGSSEANGEWAVGRGTADPHELGARDASRWRGAEEAWCCSAGPCKPKERLLDSMASLAWGNDESNMVTGSLGDAFHAGVTSTDPLRLWVDRLARAVPLLCTDSAPHPMDPSDLASIPVLRFAPDPVSFLTATVQPSNAPYYSLGPTGLLNTTTCAPAKLPLFHSLPFFLYGNASALNAVAGLPPAVPGAHLSWVDVEPITGRVVQAADRWQVNVWLADAEDPDSLRASLAAIGEKGLWPKLRPLYLPLLWLDSSSSVGPALTQAFMTQVLLPQRTASTVRIASVVTAALCALVALLAMAGSRRAAKMSAMLTVANRAGSAMVYTTLRSTARQAMLTESRAIGSGSGPWFPTAWTLLGERGDLRPRRSTSASLNCQVQDQDPGRPLLSSFDSETTPRSECGDDLCDGPSGAGLRSAWRRNSGRISTN